jgi:hypothetical protein
MLLQFLIVEIESHCWISIEKQCKKWHLSLLCLWLWLLQWEHKSVVAISHEATMVAIIFRQEEHKDIIMSY